MSGPFVAVVMSVSENKPVITLDSENFDGGILELLDLAKQASTVLGKYVLVLADPLTGYETRMPVDPSEMDQLLRALKGFRAFFEGISVDAPTVGGEQ